MIGELDQRVSLQAQSRAGDGGGGASVTWTEFASVWANVASGTGTDEMGPDRLESVTDYRVTLRRRSDVAAGQHVVTSMLTLVIHNILDDGPRAATMVLLCETSV
jgi:SPP1 family predicted phage head-tail adaptor